MDWEKSLENNELLSLEAIGAMVSIIVVFFMVPVTCKPLLIGH
jgi:hypothetical protein